MLLGCVIVSASNSLLRHGERRRAIVRAEHTQILAQVSASIGAELDAAAANAAKLGDADARARRSAVAELRRTLASSVRQQLLLAASSSQDGDTAVADGVHRMRFGAVSTSFMAIE
jgi:hypothetical protein